MFLTERSQGLSNRPGGPSEEAASTVHQENHTRCLLCVRGLY